MPCLKMKTREVGSGNQDGATGIYGAGKVFKRLRLADVSFEIEDEYIAEPFDVTDLLEGHEPIGSSERAGIFKGMTCRSAARDCGG